MYIIYINHSNVLFLGTFFLMFYWHAIPGKNYGKHVLITWLLTARKMWQELQSGSVPSFFSLRIKINFKINSYYKYVFEAWNKMYLGFPEVLNFSFCLTRKIVKIFLIWSMFFKQCSKRTISARCWPIVRSPSVTLSLSSPMGLSHSSLFSSDCFLWRCGIFRSDWWGTLSCFSDLWVFSWWFFDCSFSLLSQVGLNST